MLAACILAQIISLSYRTMFLSWGENAVCFTRTHLCM